jgi:raffinose/stachyose/melibiose transport system permease protein
MRLSRRAAWRNLLWLLPAFLLVGIFVYYPIVSNFAMSTYEWGAFQEPEFVGFGNYVRAFEDPVFWQALGNNVAFAVVSLLVQVAGAMALAACLEFFVGRKLSGALRVLYFIPATVSITVGGILFTFMLDPNIGVFNEFLNVIGLDHLQRAWLGEGDTAMGSIIIMSQWLNFGYTTLLFVVAMQKVPRELYEAAQIEGAGPVRSFFTITVPMVRQMTTLMMITTLSGAFLVFNEVQVMTSGGPNNSTQVLGTWLYYNAFTADRMGYAAALATIIFIITFGAGLFQIIRANKKKVELV